MTSQVDTSDMPETHEADVIVCIDEDDGSRSRLGGIGLGLVRGNRVQLGGRRDSKVGSWNNDGFQDPASDRAMPAMIVLGTEESLEHRYSLGIVVFDEIFRIVRVVIQNVKDRVGPGFHPKVSIGLTLRYMRMTSLSQAATMTCGSLSLSSRERMPSLNSRVKKSSQNVNP